MAARSVKSLDGETLKCDVAGYVLSGRLVLEIEGQGKHTSSRPRFYASSGSWIVIDSRANGTPLGQHVAAPDGIADITLTAIGTRPIVSATGGRWQGPEDL